MIKSRTMLWRMGINRKSLKQDVSDELNQNYVVMKVNNAMHLILYSERSEVYNKIGFLFSQFTIAFCSRHSHPYSRPSW